MIGLRGAYDDYWERSLRDKIAAMEEAEAQELEPLGLSSLALGDVGWRAHVLALRLEQRLPLRRPAQQVPGLSRRYRARWRRRVCDVARRWAVRT